MNKIQEQAIARLYDSSTRENFLTGLSLAWGESIGIYRYRSDESVKNIIIVHNY